MTNRAAPFLRLVGLAGATLLVSACGVFSPVQTDYPYVPADGARLSVPGLQLRGLVVVSDEKGGPGTITGQAVNGGADAVRVALVIGDGQPTEVDVPAYSDDAISLGGEPVVVDSVPEPPGALVQLTITTAEAGRNVVQVPVLPSTRYYEGLAPSATATPTASPGASPDVNPEEEGTSPRG